MAKSSKRRKTFVPLKGVQLLTSQRAARTITSQFHKVRKGRQAYQDASILLTNLNRSCSRFVFKTITTLGLRPQKGEKPLRLLEIGAINTQILNCSWLNVLAIDKQSRHPSIKQIDFFDLIEKDNSFDIVCNGMVLNCVDNPVKRGLMIINCQKLLKVNGLFFLSVPKRCFKPKEVAPFFIKFALKQVYCSQSAKISYYCFQKISSDVNFEALVTHKLSGQLQISIKETKVT